MKAKDLMIGDWVYIYHPTRERTPVKVDGVWIETIERIDNGLTREDSPMFRIVEPIPLTTEILEKNGFEKHDFKFIWTLRTKEYKVQIEWKGKTMLEIGHNFTIKDEQGRYDNVTYIRGWQENIYVHELQHALRLCGINLEIKL